jgi:hypothetical protein
VFSIYWMHFLFSTVLVLHRTSIQPHFCASLIFSVGFFSPLYGFGSLGSISQSSAMSMARYSMGRDQPRLSVRWTWRSIRLGIPPLLMANKKGHCVPAKAENTAARVPLDQLLGVSLSRRRWGHRPSFSKPSGNHVRTRHIAFERMCRIARCGSILRRTGIGSGLRVW